MKKYIILGWCGGVGGGQIYTRNQCVIAKKIGWVPIVFHSGNEDTVIIELKQFDSNRINEMRFLPSFYSNRERELILDVFLSVIEPSSEDEFFVESNGVRFSYWGELLARKLKCKHFAFLLEFYFPYKDDYHEFFSFKLKRRELAGIGPTSLSSLFGNYQKISLEDSIFIKAYCTNSVEDVEDPIEVDYSQYDFVIGNIGRSTKPYVLNVARDLASYSKTHENKRILFLLVGGNKGTKEESAIRQSLDGCKNVDILFTGFMFPIPKSLLSHIHVATASSGCIRVAFGANLPTVVYKDNEMSPYGILGYDLSLPLPEKPEKKRTLGELLDDILFNDLCGKYGYKSVPNYSCDSERWIQLEEDTRFMMSNSKHLEYYDTSVVYPKQVMRKLYVRVLGPLIPFHFFVQIRECMSKMIVRLRP